MSLQGASAPTTQEQPEPLFRGDRIQLFPFQEESIARDYLATEDGGGMLVCWSTGAGKSIFALRMATLLAEDQQTGTRRHDLTIVLAERGKIGEWVEDFTRYTRLSVRKHHGPSRMKQLEADGLPDVLITTYETAKADLVKVVKPTGKRRALQPEPGPLFEAIRGKSVMWIGDEFAAKLGNRSSGLYKAIDWTFKQMRKTNPRDHRVFALTATPIESGWENAFNQGRLLFPERMPTVAEFEAWMVEYRDPTYGTPRYRESAGPAFAQLFAPVMDRRRKTDPDIMAQFPRKTEQAVHVEMGPDQARLYRMIRDLQAASQEPIPGMLTVLRMIADHPAALVLAAQHGESALVKMIVEEVGAEHLSGMPCAKADELINRLIHVVKSEGEKAVCFTFFGQTVLPILAQAMRAKGLKVYENHGGLRETESHQRRMAFRSDPRPCVFLTSDAGARGINLPEATHIYEYEGALTFANHTQRIDRIHRISSTSPSITCTTMVTSDTVEEAILEVMLRRNAQSDILLGDLDAEGEFLTVAQRKEIMLAGRRTSRR